MGEYLRPTMKFLCAYAMLKLGGNDSPSVSDVKKVCESIGYEWQDEDNSKVEDFVEEIAGQNWDEVLANGLTKVKSCGSCGGGGGGGGGAAAAAGGDAPAAEAKPESSSSDDAAVGGMFEEDY